MPSFKMLFEPQHEISNNVVCATSKYSEYDQEIPQSQTADNPAQTSHAYAQSDKRYF